MVINALKWHMKYINIIFLKEQKIDCAVELQLCKYVFVEKQLEGEMPKD